MMHVDDDDEGEGGTSTCICNAIRVVTDEDAGQEG